MGNRIHMRAVQRAAEIADGPVSLAMYLEAAPAVVAAWMQGTRELPPAVFLKLVDIIIDYDASRMRGAIPAALADMFRHREAANR